MHLGSEHPIDGLGRTRLQDAVVEHTGDVKYAVDGAKRVASRGEQRPIWEIRDGKSVCALLRAGAWLKKKGRSANGAAGEEKRRGEG